MHPYVRVALPLCPKISFLHTTRRDVNELAFRIREARTQKHTVAQIPFCRNSPMNYLFLMFPLEFLPPSSVGSVLRFEAATQSCRWLFFFLFVWKGLIRVWWKPSKPPTSKSTVPKPEPIEDQSDPLLRRPLGEALRWPKKNTSAYSYRAEKRYHWW